MTTIPYSPENSQKIREIGERLVGSCNNADDDIREAFGEDATLTDLDPQLLRELDDITMLCDGCGWWAEADDIDDNLFCPDCR